MHHHEFCGISAVTMSAHTLIAQNYHNAFAASSNCPHLVKQSFVACNPSSSCPPPNKQPMLPPLPGYKQLLVKVPLMLNVVLPAIECFHKQHMLVLLCCYCCSLLLVQLVDLESLPAAIVAPARCWWQSVFVEWLLGRLHDMA